MNQETCLIMCLLPLVVFYLTNPNAAIIRSLSTAKTNELTGDCCCIISVICQWRNRQKKQFLGAVAHGWKNIVADINGTAPVIQISKNLNMEDSPLLVIDLDVWGSWMLMKLSKASWISTICGSYLSMRYRFDVPSQLLMEGSGASIQWDKSGIKVGTLRADRLFELFSQHFIISTWKAKEIAHALATNGMIMNIANLAQNYAFKDQLGNATRNFGSEYQILNLIIWNESNIVA